MPSNLTWSETQVGIWLDRFVQGLGEDYVIVALGDARKHDETFQEIIHRMLPVSAHGIVETGSPYDSYHVVAYVFPIESKQMGREVQEMFQDTPAMHYMRFYQEGEGIRAFAKDSGLPKRKEAV